jgi:hypothetical protein
MHIRWTDSAVRDFTTICDYIEKRSSGPQPGMLRFRSTIRSICWKNFPNTGELVETLTHASWYLAACPILPFIGFIEIQLRSFVFCTERSSGLNRLVDDSPGMKRPTIQKPSLGNWQPMSPHRLWW